MSKIYKQIFFFTALIYVSAVHAQDCIKIRNDHDSFDCMQFTQQQKEEASRYGLWLGMPYKAAEEKLIKHHWSIRKDAAGVDRASPNKAGLTCGSGIDAVCSAEFIKESETLFLIFSGTNDGIPLININKTD